MRNHRVESSTRVGGFCLCRRGFNRRVDGGNHRVDGGNHRVESSTRGGGFCLCRRGFNRRVDGGNRRVDGENHPVNFWNLRKQDQKPIPIQESLIFDGGE